MPARAWKCPGAARSVAGERPSRARTLPGEAAGLALPAVSPGAGRLAGAARGAEGRPAAGGSGAWPRPAAPAHPAQVRCSGVAGGSVPVLCWPGAIGFPAGGLAPSRLILCGGFPLPAQRRSL